MWPEADSYPVKQDVQGTCESKTLSHTVSAAGLTGILRPWAFFIIHPAGRRTDVCALFLGRPEADLNNRGDQFLQLIDKTANMKSVTD